MKHTVASRKRELKLLTELQTKFGYVVMPAGLPAAQRTGMVFSFKSQSCRRVRCAKLAVDDDSALGLLLAAAVKQSARTKKSGRR